MPATAGVAAPGGQVTQNRNKPNSRMLRDSFAARQTRIAAIYAGGAIQRYMVQSL